MSQDHRGLQPAKRDPGQLTLPGLPSGEVPSIRLQLTIVQRNHLLNLLDAAREALDEITFFLDA